MATVDKAKAREQIGDLVARFEALSRAQKRAQKEEATKQGFILRLFQALGWDTTDSVNEVVPEEAASGGSVDYAFKTRDVSRFFLEAKRPRESLDEWAQKSIFYALKRGIDWLVLTNFQELRLYYALGDTDKPELLIWKQLDCEDFEKEFETLWLLSKESFETGLIDEAARKDARLPRRVTLKVEDTLFKQFQRWREELLNQLLGWHNAKHLRPLTVDEAEDIVLRLFNRLVFIRNCEDRDIEERTLWAAVQDTEPKARKAKTTSATPQLSLLPSTPEGPLLHRLREIFSYYRGIYDSDLFGATVKDRHLLDDPDIHLDDGKLRAVIEGLYKVPGRYAQYDFRHISADIMGRVYEMYLGIVPKAARQQRQRQLWLERADGTVDNPIELEARRERRKAQGIYYTPDWVVDYIVRQTVGRALNELPSAQAQQIRVLDPACGSGSFLIRAYEEILGWYARTTTVAKSVAALDWNQRVTILTKHMYGVDLDSQAVEIARLNLMLTALAGKNALPLLRDNIKRGNSLIAGKPEELRQTFGEEKHPINWPQDFPPDGLFDVVIGNPPYVRIQGLDREEKHYYDATYSDVASGNYDLYLLFIRRALDLLRPGGYLGFIVPNKFFQAQYGAGLRGLLARDEAVAQIVDFKDAQVFGSGTTYTTLVFLRRAKNPTFAYTDASKYVPSSGTPFNSVVEQSHTLLNANSLSRSPWTFLSGQSDALARKLESISIPLGQIAERIFQGIRTSANDTYVLHNRGSGNAGTRNFSTASKRLVSLEKTLLRPIVKGQEIKRYAYLAPENWVLVPYEISQGSVRLLTAAELARLPNTWDYLREHEITLRNREDGRMNHAEWYAFGRLQNIDLMPNQKILTPDLAARASFTLDTVGIYFVSGYGIALDPSYPCSIKYVLALLNSKVLDHYLREITTRLRGGFYRYFAQFLEPLPIRRLDLAKPEEKAQHDRIVALVEEMLALQQRRRHPAAPLTAADQEELDRRIAQQDRAIDEAVYDLYGLTADERRIVEDAVPAPAAGASTPRRGARRAT